MSLLRKLLRALPPYGPIVLLVGLVVGCLAYGYSATRPDVYEAQREVTVGDANASQTSAPEAERNVATQSAILRSRPVSEEAAKRVNTLDAAQISASLAISSPDKSDLIIVTARRPSVEEARQVVQAVTDAYIATRRDQIVQYQGAIETQLAASQAQIAALQRAVGTSTSPTDPDVQALAGATAAYQSLLTERQRLTLLVAQAGTAAAGPVYSADTPVSPSPIKAAIFGLFFGSLIAAGLAAAKEQIAPRLRSPRSVEDKVGVAVLSELSEGSKGSLKAAQAVLFAAGGEGTAGRAQLVIISDNEDSAWEVGADITQLRLRAGQSSALVAFWSHDRVDASIPTVQSVLERSNNPAELTKMLAPSHAGGPARLDVRVTPEDEALILSPSFVSLLERLSIAFPTLVATAPSLERSNVGLVAARVLGQSVAIVSYRDSVGSISTLTSRLNRAESKVLGLLTE